MFAKEHNHLRVLYNTLQWRLQSLCN